MGKYHRLAREERYQIDALLKSGQSLRAIARNLKRNPATICRELKRNRDGIGGLYWPENAHERAFRRKSKVRLGARKLRGDLEKLIWKRLKQDWSPEQIAGRLRCEKNPVQISYGSIYRYVYEKALFAQDVNSSTLFESLRTKRKNRIRRKPAKYGSVARARRLIEEREFIEKRPEIVEQRKRIGDYERDTVRGRDNLTQTHVLLTIVDRTSRLTRVAWTRKDGDSIHRATVALLKGLPVRTITNDNGSEFSKFKTTASALNTKIYFSHPRCCWERGTNENTNGLLRQYFPRTTDFTRIDPKEVRRVEKLLNSRPRKCLGFKTPAELHRGRLAS